MDSRRVSAAIGFLLLIGCVIGIVLLIHNSGTRRSSPSLNSDGAKDKHHLHFVSSKKGNGFGNDPNYRSSQPTMQEMNELADDLQRFLSPKSKLPDNVNGTLTKPVSKGNNNVSVNHKPLHHQPSSSRTGNKASISAVNYSNIPGTTSHRLQPNNSFNYPGGPTNHRHHYQVPPSPVHQSHKPLPGTTAGGKLAVVDISEPGGLGKGGLPNELYTTSWLPSMIQSAPVVPLSSPHLNSTFNQHLHPSESKFTPHQQQYRRPYLPNGSHRGNMPFLPTLGYNMTPAVEHNRAGHSSRVPTVGPLDIVDEEMYDDDLSEEDDRRKPPGGAPPDDEDYSGDDLEWEGENNYQDPRDKAGEPEPKDFIADFQTLFELANHLSTSPANNKGNSLFQGFLKVINETIDRGNNTRLLSELNELYRGRLKSEERERTNSPKTSGTTQQLRRQEETKMNPYETSITALVFMSFGVFLLNQIHSFVQKSALASNTNETDVKRSLLDETFFDWYVDPSINEESGKSLQLGREPSSLDILFEEPKGSGIESNTTEWQGRSANEDDNSFSSSKHINNMFRALLNIVNAYTKNPNKMECIWSLYCQDLDSTAGRKGLYGVAARINSVGLRLIMDQIPPELTLDVVLRSLVGWDGLPCRKMFPKCAAGNGTISLVDDDSDLKSSK